MSDELVEIEDEDELNTAEDTENDLEDDDPEKDEETDGEEETDDLEEVSQGSADSPFGLWDDTVTAKRIKLLLYGLSGMGKTTMAASFPKPLFLDLEGGMLSVRKFRPLRYPADPSQDIVAYSQVRDFYLLVKGMQNPPFETIVVDSLNELQLLLTQHIVGKYSKVKRQYDDQMTLADYGKANRDFAKVVRLFIKLPFHVVFTAASTQKDFGEDGDVQVAPKFVGKQVGPDVQRMMDMIGYCYSKPTAAGTGEHYVSFRMSPKYLAKDRLGIVNRDIPNNFDSLMSSTKE